LQLCYRVRRSTEWQKSDRCQMMMACKKGLNPAKAIAEIKKMMVERVV
jgi:succinate dehydrogenase/fumarate reductase-like Fe-S protein